MSTHEVTAPSRAHLDQLRRSFAGEIVGPGDAGYRDGCRVWNAVFDRRPALIVRPTSPDEVATAIRFGREHDLEIAVRGGGHSASGHSTVDRGLVIDLRALNGVSVDPATRRAHVAGGALLGQLDTAAQAHGLVCPVGVVGHTGVAGLTLGGGVGRLQRHFGLTIDNLRGVELVTADGRLIRASKDEEPDLFWGLRGAGPNFGIATGFEFELQPFGGTLYRSARIYPASDAHEVWSIFREYATTAPDAVAAIYTIGRAEPAGEYPESLAGRPIVVVSFNHSGASDRAEADTAGLTRGPTPAVVTAGSQPYLEVQASSDLTMAWGTRSFILGGYIDGLASADIDAIIDHAARAPGEGSVSVSLQGGAISRLPEDATAFSGREAPFDISADTAWKEPSLDEANADWVRGAMAIVGPGLLPGRYVNELSDASPDMTRSSYGDAKLERLRSLKRAWDPENVFHLNHNIAP
jgi:FAD/FMN-containing dehydrogenase